MNLFEREQFERFVAALPGVTIVHQWGNASVAKVGGKIFAAYTIWGKTDQWNVGFKCSDLSFEMLQELEGISPAPYLARAKWVTVERNSELSSADLQAYIVEAHRLIASRLSRATREQLGLDPEMFKKN